MEHFLFDAKPKLIPRELLLESSQKRNHTPIKRPSTMTIQTNFDLYICIVDDDENDQQHSVDAEQDPHHFDLLAENDFLLDDDSLISDYSDDSFFKSFDESEDHAAMIRYLVDNEMDDADDDDDDDDDDDGDSLVETDSLLVSRCRRLGNRMEQAHDHMDVSRPRGSSCEDQEGALSTTCSAKIG
jgi:hypothetical protein